MQNAPKLTARQSKAIFTLLKGPHMREELDRIVGCSNAPALVAQLRRKSLDIECTLVPSTDRYGKPCKPGLYALTVRDHEKLREWYGAPV